MTTDTIGGIFSFAAELSRGLSRRGIEVCLATLGPAPDRAQRAELSAIANLQLFENHSALEWMDDPWQEVDLAGDWLLELAESTQPDVVHLNGYCHAALPWRLPVVVGAHSCVLSFYKAVFACSAPDRYDEYRRRVGRGLRAANVVVAPSLGMLESLSSNYGIVSDGRVIPNGVDPTRWPVQEKQPFFLAAGRFRDPAKNLAMLEKVAALLPWPTYVAGEAPEQGPSSALTLLGRLPQAELARIMGQASVFLHPARYEPFGLAPLEAACGGAALVLSDLETLRQVWDKAALFVRPDDHEALLSAARFLARSEKLRNKFAGFARRRALDFSAADTANAYAQLYSELLWRAPRRELEWPSATLASGGHS
jgi:glycosyltransferase involved in cell wall biosynthesis